MKRMKVIALAAAALLGLSGCQLVSFNEEKDRNQVISTVGDQQILKSELLDNLDSYATVYEMMGYTDFLTSSAYADQVKTLKDNILEALVQKAVESQKAEAAGLIDHSEAGTQAALEKVKDQWSFSNLLATAKAAAEKDASIDPEEQAMQALKDKLEQNGTSYEQELEAARDLMGREALREENTKAVQATEEETRALYDEQLEAQKSAIQKDASTYETYYSEKGSVSVYKPTGYVFVKHILVEIPEDIQEAIKTLESDGDTEAAEAKKQEALATIKPEAEEVLKKAQAGEDFDQLIEQYNDDTGMTVEPAKTDGYLVGPNSNYEENFRTAALAMSRVGEVSSELVETPYGYHILKLVDITTEGAVPYENVKQECFDLATERKQNSVYNELLEQWKQELGVKTYANRI
ncbi:MAG: peptidylprolyl isomerase [Christensenellales bacterium]|jgi:foldase protein PrsA